MKIQSLKDIRSFADALKLIGHRRDAVKNDSDQRPYYNQDVNALCDVALIGDARHPYVDIFFDGLLNSLKKGGKHGRDTCNELLEEALKLGNVKLSGAVVATYNFYNKKHNVQEAKASLRKWGATEKLAHDRVYDLVKYAVENPEWSDSRSDLWTFLDDYEGFRHDPVVGPLVRKICEAGDKKMLNLLKQRFHGVEYGVVTIRADALEAAIENNRYDCVQMLLFPSKEDKQVPGRIEISNYGDVKVLHKNEAYALFLLYKADLVNINKAELVDLKVKRKIEGSALLYNTLHQLSTNEKEGARQDLEWFAKKLVSEGLKLGHADFRALYHDASASSREIIKDIEKVQKDFQTLQRQYLTESKSLYSKFKHAYKAGDIKSIFVGGDNDCVRKWLLEGMEEVMKSVFKGDTLQGEAIALFKNERVSQDVLKDKDIERLIEVQKGPSRLEMGFLIFFSLITAGLVWGVHKLHEKYQENKEILQFCNAFEGALQSEYVKAMQPTWVNRSGPGELLTVDF